MNTLQERILLFLIGCIGTRTLFVYLAKNASKQNLKYMGYLALLPAIGFLGSLGDVNTDTVFGLKVAES